MVLVEQAHGHQEQAGAALDAVVELALDPQLFHLRFAGVVGRRDGVFPFPFGDHLRLVVEAVLHADDGALHVGVGRADVLRRTGVADLAVARHGGVGGPAGALRGGRVGGDRLLRRGRGGGVGLDGGLVLRHRGGLGLDLRRLLLHRGGLLRRLAGLGRLRGLELGDLVGQRLVLRGERVELSFEVGQRRGFVGGLLLGRGGGVAAGQQHADEAGRGQGGRQGAGFVGVHRATFLC